MAISLATIDRPLLIENLLHIDNKQGVVVPFKFNKGQAYFNRNKASRNIILKHRQGGWCLEPTTPVLTTDLRWIPIRDIHIGDSLIGFDESTDGIGKGYSRKFREAVVLSKTVRKTQAFKINTSKGSLILSPNHSLLAKHPSGLVQWRSILEGENGKRGRLKEGYKIQFFVSPWGESTYEDGWFGGFIDGEGSLGKTRAQLKITQKSGDTMDRCKRYVSNYGNYLYSKESSGFGGSADSVTMFGMAKLFEVFGKSRPTRFLKRKDWWEGKDISGKGKAEWVKIDSIEAYSNSTELIDIETSTKTFIAAGFASHNSSSILADMFMDCITVPHTQCAVVSHEGRSTQRLLDRVQFYYDTMDKPKPDLGSESRTEKSFPGMHSSIYIGTAGSRAFGRGDTIRKALLSEFAFYEDGESILNAVEDAVPITGELTLECTPNGEGNTFHEQWIRAREGKSPYKPFFFPWWWTTDYQIPRGSPLALPSDIGELHYIGEEEELIVNHHLTEDQIRWRRWKIAEKQGLFWQEYPEDEVSCFISIGDPVFDVSILNTMASGCYEGQHHPEGWTYWIPPDPTGKTHYVIGSDSAAGSPDGSFSTAVVLDDYWRVCATFQARVEPNLLATTLAAMGKYYNNAMIAIERNFTGYAVLATLAGGHNVDDIGKGKGIYGNIYRQHDFLTGKVTANLGWWTNDQTKEYMRTSLRDRLPQLHIWDANLVRQLRGYRYIKMKPTAQTFDDLAIALMIACAVKKSEGGARGFQGSIPGYNW